MQKIFPPLVKVLYVEVFYYPRNPCACTLAHRQLVVFPKRTKQKVFLDVSTARFRYMTSFALASLCFPSRAIVTSLSDARA